jgi:hypothetical protein
MPNGLNSRAIQKKGVTEENSAGNSDASVPFPKAAASVKGSGSALADSSFPVAI